MAFSNSETPAADSPALAYYTVRAGAMSFENKKVRSFVKQFINDSDTVLNACAGESTLAGDVTRNDLRDDVDAAYHSPVSRLDEVVTETHDVIIYDPPFSPDQMSTYGLEKTLWPGYGDDILTVFDSLLRPGGLLIQLGFHATVDQNNTFGYSTKTVGIFNQLGRNDDWSIAVARKPTEQASPSHVSTANQKVRASNCIVPNQPHVEDAGSFNISYQQCQGTVDDRLIASQFLSLINGKTLALHWGDEPAPFTTSLEDRHSPLEGVVPYRGPADRIISRSLGGGNDKTGISLSPNNLHQKIPSIAFDTVILWPHQFASNWTVSFNGSEIGYIRAFKRALDAYLPSESTVILVGNTATGMRSSWDYEHVGIDILDGTKDLRCTYLSSFGKPQTGLFEDRNTNAPVDVGYRDTSSSGNWIATQSLDTFHYTPALYVDCPTCGAHPNNMCATAGGHTDVHDSRCEAFNSNLERTGTIRYFHHRRYGSVDYQPDQSQAEYASPSAGTQPTAASTQDEQTGESKQATFLEVL